jgi:hypothetical protein
MSTFNFTEGYEVRRKCEPARVPSYLENYIVDSIGSALSNLKISSSGFSEKNYGKGGMVLFAGVKMHPEWENEYLQDMDTRFVNMCKSCGSKALKGCCPKYLSSNRKELKMVIGWHSLS